MYEFARGPLVWAAFIVFGGGVLYKLIRTGLLAKREKTVFPTMSVRFGLRSIMHWAVPMGSLNMRARPVLTLVSFAFHLCLLVTPLLVMGHAVLWRQSWGVSWWSLPARAADVMTLVVIAGGVFFILRRIALPEVRNVTSWKDYLLVLLVAAPYVTGFIAHQQWLDYEHMMVLHIASGVLWLVAIPFTWLTHMLWFVFTRAYMGSEFGSVRHARDW